MSSRSIPLFLLAGLPAGLCSAQEIPLVYDAEHTGADCARPVLPAFDELPTVRPLPDPFAWSAAAGRVTDFDDWRCRRAEIALPEGVHKLPLDHHELMALVAPRALLVLGNPDHEWLADESGYVSSVAASEVWRAFGIEDRFGYSIVGGHPHCGLPDVQRPEVEAFVDRFLLGDAAAETTVRVHPFETVNAGRWYEWWGTNAAPTGSESTITSAELAAGDHALTITYREDGLLLDKLNITSFAYGPMELGEEEAGGTCE